MQKVTLLILDWFGINEKTLEENSIVKASSPTFNRLFSELITRLDASGRAVWIPDWQMWNSEVGHMTIWAWRIIKQSLVKIDDSFDSGEFEKLENFKNWIKNVIDNNSLLHLFTLFWPGWVHSHSTHLEKILKIIPKNISVYLHLFADWRDLEPKSFLDLFIDFEKNVLSNYDNIKVSSIAWRYYAMDRDNNWDRVKKAYDEIVFANNKTNLSVIEYVKKSYENWLTDEFIIPAGFSDWKQVSDSDSVFFLNFRSDRAKELSKVFVEANFTEFERKEFRNLYFSTMTKYYKEYIWNYFIEDEKVVNCLGEVLQNNNLTQLHIAETEKFAHVTKFFNWGKQIVFEWEQDILIPSNKVATYDLDPEMSSWEILQAYLENSLNFDFTVLNYANGDMVGHTWNMEASIKSVMKLDEVVAKTILFCDKNNIDLLITADHGNCEEMWTKVCPKTSHTTNFVPLWYIKNWKIQKTKDFWWLANIAPTILELMWVVKPSEMIESLI